MLEYFNEKGMNRYRVWCEGWPHDMFEIMSNEEFFDLQLAVAKFPNLFTLVEIEDYEELERDKK